MTKFFKYTMSNGTTYVVVAKGWGGLRDFVGNLQDKNGIISPMSLFEFVKYVMRLSK